MMMKRGVLYLAVAMMLLSSTLFPMVLGKTNIPGRIEGYDKGVSWRPVVPLKKVAFVNFDKEGYLDDFAYLSAVPTSVFYDKNANRLFSYPLLYYTDEYPVKDDKERSLNARPGIDYFMEDWMSYCNGRLDQMVLINVDKSKVKQWPARDIVEINGSDPYTVAAKLALNDWSYSNSAVVAVIDDKMIDDTLEQYSNKIKGTLEPKETIKKHFEVEKTNDIYQQSFEFDVPEGYKIMKVRSWYPCFYLSLGIPGIFENVINMSIPSGDRDLQIYYKGDEGWIEAGVTEAWNAKEGMDTEKTTVFIYKSGRWMAALTDAPTKPIIPMANNKEPQIHRSLFGFIKFGRYGRLLDVIKNIRKTVYQTDIEIYPGVELTIPDTPPYGCKDVVFRLEWDNPSYDLGIAIIGPSGEVVARTDGKKSYEEDSKNTVFEEKGDNYKVLYLEKLGECKENEHYKVAVFALTDIHTPVDFTISYSWEKKASEEERDALTSATEGAVLASVLNSPLIYTRPNGVPEVTENVLYKLGVEKIYLVDIGGRAKEDVIGKLKGICKLERFTDCFSIYDKIREFTGQNDIIFSTLDPWTYWYVGGLEPAGEWKGALAIGPAAYLAAHHGSPVIIIENHPEISSAVSWHINFWRRYPDGFSNEPTVAEMHITGRRVYNFLKEHGFDKEGEENLITVAGQFDLGFTWDRVFVGKAKSGRFFGQPVDLSTWICRNIFYPALIFENPALNGEVTLINGSKSARRFPWYGRLGLRILKESKYESFRYPVLDTLICYDYRFNTRASKYWGFKYKCADGTIPGESKTGERIDEGVMERINGKKGDIFPDLSAPDVQPFYLKRAGYEPVYSTNFSANMKNLNNGVILWLINTHGGSTNGGLLMFWDVKRENPAGYPPVPLAGYKKEPNPWRAYEWFLGSTEEPDTMTAEIHGILAALLGNPNMHGVITTAFDWAPAKLPIRDAIGTLLSKIPIIKHIVPDWLKDTQDYHDGVVITVFLGRFGTSWYNGTQIDDVLGNIHSTGISATSCLIAGSYLQVALVRHGSVFQIMDPWATSWYSDVWQGMVPRGIALGKTIGEIYSEGLKKVGILYITEPPQWWWDLMENVCLFGDPKLRVWTPSTEYSDANHWMREDVQPLRWDGEEELYVDGHMLFGASAYPHAKSKLNVQLIVAIIAVIIVIILAIIGASLLKRKEGKNKENRTKKSENEKKKTTGRRKRKR